MEKTAHHEYEISRIKAPYLQLTIIILGVFMAILDTSVVNVAIPTMETELSATTDQIQWVLTAYMLVIGVLVPISGWLTDKFGARRLFLFSLIAFTIGSALCGAAWNLSSLILFRVLQAIGGGFMMPVAMSMIYRIFPPNRRGFIMGILGIAMMAAPAFGPALSGYFVEYASWRLIFYVNVPIGIVGFVVGLFSLHHFPHEIKGKLDIWGFALSTVGFFSLLYGFSSVSNDGWKSTSVIGFITVGVVSLILLVVVELNVENPIIQLKVLKNYMFSMSLVISSIINTALFVGIFLLPLYLQNVMGYSALRTGLFMTPAALASAIVMPISGKLMDRIGARPLGLLGLLAVTISTYGFAELSVHTSSNTIQWLYIIRSVGMALTMMPIMTAGMNTVPLNLVSQGTAMTNTVRQVASSLGTAVLTTYMTVHAKVHTQEISWNVTRNSPQGHMLQGLIEKFHAHGMSIVEAQHVALMWLYGMVEKMGFVAGLDDTFYVAAILTAIAFLCVIFYGSKKEREIRLGRMQDKKSGSGGPKEQIVLE